jgi:hypothetical protein
MRLAILAVVLIGCSSNAPEGDDEACGPDAPCDPGLVCNDDGQCVNPNPEVDAGPGPDADPAAPDAAPAPDADPAAPDAASTPDAAAPPVPDAAIPPPPDAAPPVPDAATPPPPDAAPPVPDAATPPPPDAAPPPPDAGTGCGAVECIPGCIVDDGVPYGGAPATPELCAGVACASPPANVCADPQTLRVFDRAGSCAGGGCHYGFAEVACPLGCADATCIELSCGAVSCDAPPADHCVGSGTLRVYFPSGTCALDTCSYDAVDVECSSGCFAGACLAEADVEESHGLSVPSFQTASIAFDGGGEPHIATCRGGAIYYRRKTARGWLETVVDTDTGPTCEVGLAVAGGVAHLAYNVSNISPNQLRFATQIGHDAFDVEIVDFSAGRAPSVAVDAAGDPAVAYLAGAPFALNVARPDVAGWDVTAVAAAGAIPNPITQSLFDGAGALHVIAGEATYRSAPAVQPDAVYARFDGAWGAEPIAHAMLSRRPLGVAADGVVEAVLVRVGADPRWDKSPTSFMDRIRFESSGPAVETIRAGIAPSANAPLYAGGDALVPDGTTYWRGHDGYWFARADAAEPILDTGAGASGEAIYLAAGDWAVLRPFACEPDCASRTCGPDGCGGSCGACAAGDTCTPFGACQAMRRERVDTWVRRDVYGTVTDDGAFHFVQVGGKPAAFTGWTGAWGMPSIVLDAITTAYYAYDVITDGTSVYARTNNGMYALHGATWSAVPGVPSAAGSLVLDGAGAVHTVYAEEIDENESRIVHRSYAGGAWSAPVTLIEVETIISYVGQIDVAIDSAGELHIAWVYYDYTGSCGPGCWMFATPIHYLRRAGPSWVDSVAIGDNADNPEIAADVDDVLHLTYTKGTVSTRHWAHRAPGDALWTVEGAVIGGSGRMFVGPGGRAHFLARYTPGAGEATLRRHDPATDTWTPIAIAPLADPEVVFDTCPQAHFFEPERHNGVDRIIHVW